MQKEVQKNKNDYARLINLVNPTEDEKNLIYTKDEPVTDGQILEEVYEKFKELKSKLNNNPNGDYYYLDNGFREKIAQKKKFISEILNLACDEIISQIDDNEFSEMLTFLKKKKEYKVEKFIKKNAKKVLSLIKNRNDQNNEQSNIPIEKIDQLKDAIWDAVSSKCPAWYDSISKDIFQSNDIKDRDFTQIIFLAYIKILDILKDFGLINDDIINNNKLKNDSDSIKKFTVMIPGCSEHQSGLGLDFGLKNNNNECDLREKEYQEQAKTILNTAPEYGFILRYPKDKKIFTGVDFEIWHYRYVGSSELAKEIMNNGLTLEEYHIAQHILRIIDDKIKTLSNEEIIKYLEGIFHGDNDISFMSQYIGNKALEQIQKNREILKDIEEYTYKKLKDKLNIFNIESIETGKSYNGETSYRSAINDISEYIPSENESGHGFHL